MKIITANTSYSCNLISLLGLEWIWVIRRSDVVAAYYVCISLWILWPLPPFSHSGAVVKEENTCNLHPWCLPAHMMRLLEWGRGRRAPVDTLLFFFTICFFVYSAENACGVSLSLFSLSTNATTFYCLLKNDGTAVIPSKVNVAFLSLLSIYSWEIASYVMLLCFSFLVWRPKRHGFIFGEDKKALNISDMGKLYFPIFA